MIYLVDERPPWPRLILLGLQHAGLLSAYLVLIVVVFKAGGASHSDTVSAVSLGMAVAAIAAVLQALRKGPVGSGYLAAPVFSAIYLGPSILAAKSVGLPAVFGMTIVAGLLEMVLARYLLKLRVFFPPAISGFIVAIIGIQLGLVAVAHVLDIDNYGRPDYTTHVAVAVLTLFLTVGLSIWASGMARLMCSMIGLVVGFIISAVFGLIPAEHWAMLRQAQIVAVPDPGFISYEWDTALLPAFLVSAIAAALRTVGVITTCQKINDDDWKHPDLETIRKGMFADGLGCALAGLAGTMGMSAGPSLVGVSKAAGATSRYIAFAAGGILVLFSLMPVVASVFLILPNAVIGAALMFTAAFMISGGIQIMTTRNLDDRMTYVIGFSMLLGLSKDVFQDFYNSLPQFLHPVTSTMMPLAVVSALFLHGVFRIGSRRKATFGYESMACSLDDLAELLEKQGKTWAVDRAVMDRAEATIRQVLGHINGALLASEALEIELSYDDFTLIVCIEYLGTLLTLPHVGVRRRNFVEEEAFSYGLADFLAGAYPDRMESSANGSSISITLFFAT